MLLSIAIVTFNAAKALGATLDSVAAQDAADFECLLVDGASTDDTVEIARSYAHKIPSMRIKSEPDQGLYDAMNKAIARSNASYVLFLNAGDVLHDKDVLTDFERLIAAQDKLPSMVYGHTLVVTHSNATFLRRVRRLDYICHGQPTIHQSVFFLRERHLENLYAFQRYPISSDYAAMASIQCEDPDNVLVWDRVVSDFHNDPRGVSNRHFKLRVLDAWRVQREIVGVPLFRRVYSVFRRALAHAFYNFRMGKP